MFGRNTKITNAPANTTFEFIGEEHFGISREGLPIKAITCQSGLRYFSLDELRINDHFTLKNGLIPEEQMQILEEVVKRNIGQASPLETLSDQSIQPIDASKQLSTSNNNQTLYNEIPAGGLFGNTSPIKDTLNQLFEKATTNNNNQGPLSGLRPTEGLIDNNSAIKEPLNQPTPPNGSLPLFASANQALSSDRRPAGGLFGNYPPENKTEIQPTAITGSQSLFANTNPTPLLFGNNSSIKETLSQAAVTTEGQSLFASTNQAPLSDLKPPGGLFGNNLPAKDTETQPTALTGDQSLFATTNQAPLSDQKPAEGLIENNSPRKEAEIHPTATTGGQSLFASTNPAPLIGSSSTGGLFGNKSSIKETLIQPAATTGGQSLFASTNQAPLGDEKPVGGLFSRNSPTRQTLPQPAVSTGLFSAAPVKSSTENSKLFTNTSEDPLNKNQKIMEKSTKEIEGDAPIDEPLAEKISISNQDVVSSSETGVSIQHTAAQLEEKKEEVPQNLDTNTSPINLAEEIVKKHETEIQPAQKKEQNKNTGPQSKGFYQELTKRMFTATIMEVLEEYEAKVPEDLLENTDFMPKLFELFESYNIEFTKKAVPVKKVVSNIQVNKPANLDMSSNAKELD